MEQFKMESNLENDKITSLKNQLQEAEAKFKALGSGPGFLGDKEKWSQDQSDLHDLITGLKNEISNIESEYDIAA